MATVRLTQRIKSDIIRNADTVHKKKIENCEARRPNHLAKEIYDYMMEPYADALEKMPEEFFRRVEHITIQRINNVALDINLKFATPLIYPERTVPSMQSRGITFPFSTLPYIISLNGNNWINACDELVAWKTEYEDTSVKAREFRRSVEKLLDSHLNLASALKAWPPLKALLPDYVLSQHEFKVERKPKAETSSNTPEDINLAAMTAAVAAHRITGSK